MGGPIHRSVGAHRAARRHPVSIESLEPRTLFTVHLALVSNTLFVTGDAGVSNDMTLELLGNGNLQVSESSDLILGNTALFNAGWSFDDDLHAFRGPETTIGAIVIDLTDGQDQIKILNSDRPIFIQPSAAAESESIEIGDRLSIEGAQGITAPITINGALMQFLAIYIEDNLNPNNVDPTITSTQVLNFAGAAINFTAAPPLADSPNPRTIIAFETGVGTSGLIFDQDLDNPAPIAYQVDAHGPGTIGVQHLNANSFVNVQPQIGGSERVHIGSLGLISGVLGQVLMHGNQGTVSVDIDDHNEPNAHTYEVKTGGSTLMFLRDGVEFATMAEPCTAFTLQTGPAFNTVKLDVSATTTGFLATVYSENTANTIEVNYLSASSILDLVGSGGTNYITLRAVSVRGAVHLSNSTGVNAVTIDGSDTFTAQVVTVSSTQVTGLGDAVYSLADVTSLYVIGGTAFDNFTVTPAATVAMTVDGGPASGASPDRLEVITAQTTGVRLSLSDFGTPLTGSYYFTNRYPLSFTRIGTVTPTYGDLTGTVYNEQTGVPIASSTVTVDENNNGVADGGEPTTTTDSSGIFFFRGLPTGTFALLPVSSGLQSLSTVSVTVAAGVLAAPALVPLVPIPAADGAPDLVATLIPIATGKIGAIKPKVRVKVSNVGGAMTSPAALQILLVASPDALLDSNDQTLLTTSTPPVLLKANGSKTFTLTGSTAASLAKGNYVLLASVDAANAVAESDESNNVAASTKAIALAPSVVDLTGKFIALPKKASKSKLLPVSFSIQNLGTIPATGTISFDFFASSDNTLDDSDVSLGTGFPVAAHLAAGRSQLGRFKLSISPSLPAGSYYLVAKVNSTSSISELDSSNNVVFSVTPIAIS